MSNFWHQHSGLKNTTRCQHGVTYVLLQQHKTTIEHNTRFPTKQSYVNLWSMSPTLMQSTHSLYHQTKYLVTTRTNRLWECCALCDLSAGRWSVFPQIAHILFIQPHPNTKNVDENCWFVVMWLLQRVSYVHSSASIVQLNVFDGCL